MLLSCTKFVQNMFRSDNFKPSYTANWAQQRTDVFTSNVYYFWPNLSETGELWQMSVRLPHTKFNDNPSSGSKVVTCVQTDGQKGFNWFSAPTRWLPATAVLILTAEYLFVVSWPYFLKRCCHWILEWMVKPAFYSWCLILN